MRRLVRLGPLVFRDPLLLCGALYLLLWFDASGFLRIGLCAAVLHEMGHIFVYLLLFRRFPVIEVTMSRGLGDVYKRQDPHPGADLSARCRRAGHEWPLGRHLGNEDGTVCDHPGQCVPCGQSAHRGVQPSAYPTAGWSSNAEMSVAIFAQIG